MPDVKSIVVSKTEHGEANVERREEFSRNTQWHSHPGGGGKADLRTRGAGRQLLQSPSRTKWANQLLDKVRASGSSVSEPRRQEASGHCAGISLVGQQFVGTLEFRPASDSELLGVESEPEFGKGS